MALDTVDKRLKWARLADGRYKSPTDAARAFGWPVSTYLGHENGDRSPSRPTAKKYAKAWKVRWEWLLEGDGPPTAKPGEIEVEGYVGAGAQYIPFDDANPGLGTTPMAIEPDSGAVIVRGDSMYPRYFDGEYLYYTKEQRNPKDLIGEECVIKLTDGRRYIKILRRGSKNNLFNLESWNAQVIEDQAVEWAAPVTWRRG